MIGLDKHEGFVNVSFIQSYGGRMYIGTSLLHADTLIAGNQNRYDITDLKLTKLD